MSEDSLMDISREFKWSTGINVKLFYLIFFISLEMTGISILLFLYLNFFPDSIFLFFVMVLLPICCVNSLIIFVILKLNRNNQRTIWRRLPINIGVDFNDFFIYLLEKEGLKKEERKYYFPSTNIYFSAKQYDNRIYLHSLNSAKLPTYFFIENVSNKDIEFTRHLITSVNWYIDNVVGYPPGTHKNRWMDKKNNDKIESS